MPTIYKVLGQIEPSAATLTTLYTVPAASSAVISTMTIANLGGTATTYRIAVRPGGEAIANKHYFAYEISIPALDTLAITLGITLAATDVLSVYSTSGNVAFSAFGSEV